MKKVFMFFWDIQKSEKTTVLLSLCIAITATALGDILAPVYYAKFTKSIAVQTPFQVVFDIVLGFIAIYGIKTILWRVGNYLLIILQHKTMQRISDYTAHHLLDIDTDFFKTGIGALVGKQNKFTKAYEKIYDEVFYNLLPSCIIFLGVIPVLLWKMPMVGGIMVAVGILFAFMTYRIALWMSPANEELSTSDSRVTNILSDQLSNIETIHSFGKVKTEKARYSKYNAIRAEKRKNAWLKGYVHWSMNDFFQMTMSIATILISLTYWEKGYFSIGDIILINSYTISLAFRLSSIGNVIKNLQGYIADAKEMIEILEYQNTISNKGTVTLPHTGGDIILEDISFGYDVETPIIKNLSLTIKQGEKVGIVGPSGSGKSTLINLLLRTMDVQKGQILINDTPIQDISLQSLRKQIALVAQEPLLFNRSIEANIKYANPNADFTEVTQAAQKAQAHDFIMKLSDNKRSLFGYSYRAGEKGNRLSGGQRQRIAIARAFLAKRPIMILDEATSSLDSHSEVAIQKALDALLLDNCTMICIAHRLATVKKMDRIIVLQEGVIIEQGSHDELMNKGGFYASLVDAQNLD